MKRIDYLIASVLILIGLTCLTASGSYLIDSSIKAYMETFFQLCMWIGVPFVGMGIIYFMIIFLRKR